jgi:hypothetical protein
MKKNVLSLMMFFAVMPFMAFSQIEKPASLPADFVPGYLITATNEKLEGFIKESLKSQGTIFFVNTKGEKKQYNSYNLQSFVINNVTYVSYSNDFYKVIVIGNKGTLYQKVSDNSGKLINTGSESRVATTTDGKTGDFYLQVKTSDDLTLITKRNFESVFAKVCADCLALQNDIKAKQIDYAQVVKAVEEYNSCTN